MRAGQGRWGALDRMGVATGGRGRRLDFLTTALCISIGTGVPWLIAIHSDDGARQLIANTFFGMIGIILSAIAFNWMSPTYGIIVLVTAGPFVTLVAILAGQAAMRAILAGLSRPRS